MYKLEGHTFKAVDEGVNPHAGSPGQQQWAGQRRQAAALLLFGLLLGSACTRATLMAVREEGEVVQLAVELAQKEQKVWQLGYEAVFGVSAFLR